MRKRGQREIYDVVIRILAAGEYALAFRRYANHGEQLTINIDFLAQGPLVGEQLFRRVRTQDDDRGMMFFINLVDPAPGCDVEIEHILPGAGVSFQNRVLDFAAVVLDLVGAGAEFLAKIAQPGGGDFYVRQLLHRLKIVEGEFLACPYFFRRPAKGQGLVVGKDDVRAQAADDLADVVVEAAYDRRNTDDDGDPDDDAEHSQCRPHLVGADGVQRHLDHFAVIASTQHGN